MSKKTDDEVMKQFNKIIEDVVSNYNAILRGWNFGVKEWTVVCSFFVKKRK